MVDTIYEIITTFVLLHPIPSVYLMGSVVAIGIVYSLMSGKYLDPSNKRKTYIISALSSWIIIVGFLYGFLDGFLEVLFKINKGGR